MAPAPGTRFGDLPPQHRKDLVRLGFLSSMAFAYTLAMCLLAQPIPSRSLHSHVALPNAVATRSAFMTLLVEPTIVEPRPAATSLRRSGRAMAVDLRPAVAMETAAPGPQPRTARRGNVFGRFFKGVWRTVS